MSGPEVGAETSADSIGDELTAAFNAETSGEGSGTTASAAQSPSSGAPVGGEQNAARSPLEAPKHWSENDRALFAKAPPEIQQRWVNRDAELQRGFDAKAQELATIKREREALDTLFAPISRDLELRGVTRQQFIGSLLGAHKYLQDSPREALLWLAEQYGVDPRQLTQPQEGDDPRYNQLNKEHQQLRSEFKTLTERMEGAAHAERLSRVEAFAEAKGDDGKLLHPYFNEVSPDILVIMKGGERDLEKVYQKALRMNDEIWEKVQAEKTLAKSAQADQQRKLEVQKAKRAAVGNESAVANGSAKPRTLGEELAANFEGWSGT